MLCTGSRFDSCRSSPIYMFINVCHGSYQHQSCGTKCSHPPIMQQSLVPQQVHTPPPVFSLWKPTIIKGYKVKYPLLFVVCTAYVFLLLKSMTNPSLPVRQHGATQVTWSAAGTALDSESAFVLSGQNKTDGPSAPSKWVRYGFREFHAQQFQQILIKCFPFLQLNFLWIILCQNISVGMVC
jgi:hypothetical protein